jgi:hypothetical protein
MMEETVLAGRGTGFERIPRAEWEAELASAPESIAARLEFMTPEHHLVRNFVVSELPRRGRPLPVREIAGALGLPIAHTRVLVEDLEGHRFFLVRGDTGAVAWAFPVTVEDTGHGLVFSTGERLWGA